MFRATKGSGVTITTILRNNAIETCPGNKIHHLREKRSACVHCAPDWKTRIGEDVTSRILDRVQGATKKNTSETLVLQRYAEILPSVNRTAVIQPKQNRWIRVLDGASVHGCGYRTRPDSQSRGPQELPASPV